MNFRTFSLAAAALLGVGLAAQTATPSTIGLFNTGTLVNGVSPYTLTGSPLGNSRTVRLYEPNSTVWPINGVWIDNTETTQWLAIGLDTTTPATLRVPSVAAGTYAIRLNFDLGIYNPATVGFTIQAAADNSLAVNLNDHLLLNRGTPTGDENYGSLASYSYTVAGLGAGLKAGANWIDFMVTNSRPEGDNPAGLYVTFSDFYGTPVPEPSTYALLLGLLTGLLVLGRRYQQSARSRRR